MNKFVTRYELLAKKLSCRTPGNELHFLEPFVFPWPRCYVLGSPSFTDVLVDIKKISQDHGAVFLPLQNDLDQEAARSGPHRRSTVSISHHRGIRSWQINFIN